YTPLSAPENHYVRINANTAIAEDGTLSGTITVTAEGQSDRAVRSVFSCRTAEWQRNLEMELLRIDPRAKITEITHTDNDRYLEQPVSITYNFSIPQYATVDQNTLIFIPLSARNFYSRAMGHLAFDTRPERRTQPFSDACSRMVDIEETVTLPDSYRQLQAPEMAWVNDSAATFRSQFRMEGNTLAFSENVRLCKRVYDAADWPAFRQAVENQKRLAVTPVVLGK
ncbi:MAG: transglutaminase, partial [Bacteroidales bacterium]|nr:transglutaminase [Bacteroidales bacterium]